MEHRVDPVFPQRTRDELRITGVSAAGQTAQRAAQRPIADGPPKKRGYSLPMPFVTGRKSAAARRVP